MNRLKTLGAAGLALATTTVASGAGAGTVGMVGNYYINYSINVPNYSVTDILLIELTANSGGITWSTPGWSVPAGPGYTQITDPFYKSDPITATFLIGVMNPPDEEGEHLVLFTNDAWANSAAYIAWGTIFLTTLEDSLIATVKNSGVSSGGDWDAGNVWAFMDAEKTNTIGDLTFGVGDSFTAIAFSDGQIIGTGDSFTTPGPSTAAPEPATWAMLIAGFLGLAWTSLRRRPAAPIA